MLAGIDRRDSAKGQNHLTQAPRSYPVMRTDTITAIAALCVQLTTLRAEPQIMYETCTVDRWVGFVTVGGRVEGERRVWKRTERGAGEEKMRRKSRRDGKEEEEEREREEGEKEDEEEEKDNKGTKKTKRRGQEKEVWEDGFLEVTTLHSFCLKKKKRKQKKKKTSSKLFLKKCAFQEKPHRTLDRKPQKAMCCSPARHLPVTPEALLPAEDRESGLSASAP